MKQTVYLSDFRDSFKRIRPDNFSYEGLGLLFDYFEQLEDDTGEEIELDVIAICCDYSEDTPENIAMSYDIDIDGVEDVQSFVIEALTNQIVGLVGVTSSGSIIYHQY